MKEIAHIRKLLAKTTPRPWKVKFCKDGLYAGKYCLVSAKNGEIVGVRQLGYPQVKRVEENAELIATLRNAIGPLLDRMEEMERDARRYKQIVGDPESARHLLHLLQQGKGGSEAFSKMLDRIADSKAAALRGKGE